MDVGEVRDALSEMLPSSGTELFVLITEDILEEIIEYVQNTRNTFTYPITKEYLQVLATAAVKAVNHIPWSDYIQYELSDASYMLSEDYRRDIGCP